MTRLAANVGYGRSAWVVDGDLWIGDEDVKAIGFLPPATE